MSTHGMLPDNGSAAASNPLMPAFNPGESVFAVDTSKLNQALMWIMHSTKKHGADIEEVKRDTAGLLAQLAQQHAAAAAPADDGLIKELESKFQGIERKHVSLNDSLLQQIQDLDVVKRALNELSEAPPRPAADTQPVTPQPPATPKESQNFVRLPDFTDAINELRSDLRKHSRFMVKVSERTGLQAAASQLERMVIRSKLKQFESKAAASPSAASGRAADDNSTDISLSADKAKAAYLRGLSKSIKRGKDTSDDAESAASASRPATTAGGGEDAQLQEVEELVKCEIAGELPLHSDAEEEREGGDAKYLVALSHGATPDDVAADAAAVNAFVSGSSSREQSSSRGGSRHGLRSRVLSIHDDAESQTESADGGSLAGGYGRTLDLKLYDERLEKLESVMQSLQDTTRDAVRRVGHMESGLYSVQLQLQDFDASQLQRSSRPQSATSHESAIQTNSPRFQDPDDPLVITTQFPPQPHPADVHNAPLPPPVEANVPLDANSEAPPSPAPAAAKAVAATISDPPPSPSPAALSPAQSVHSRRGSIPLSLHYNPREVADKTREMFLDRPEERAAKEKMRAEEAAQRVPLEDFLAVKAEAEATKKSLASAEILLKQLAVRVSGLEETSAPKAAITVLEGNTSKRIVGLEGRLRTLSSILSAKADSMTVDAVSASVEANAAGLVQLKERLDSVLMADGEDKNASDYLVLLSSLNRMKNDISVMEARLAAELKDIKCTVEHSNSSVRTLQSTFAAEKLRKLNRDKPASHGQTASAGSFEAAASKSGQAALTSTQGMVSESGHVITNAVPGTLSSSPSASRPRPRDVQGSSSAGYKGGSLSIPENAAALKVNASWPNELTHEQEIAAAHAAAALAPKTVAAVTGDSPSNVLHDDALPKPSSPSLFNIINGAKSASHRHLAATGTSTGRTHQPQFPPDYELAGLPPPTRQKVKEASPTPPQPMPSPLPHLAEGRNGAVAERKSVHVKF